MSIKLQLQIKVQNEGLSPNVLFINMINHTLCDLNYLQRTVSNVLTIEKY